MLYSPLYQSIRLILFGALSVTGLTVSAVAADGLASNSAPLSDPSDSAAVVSTPITSPNNTTRRPSTKSAHNDTNEAVGETLTAQGTLDAPQTFDDAAAKVDINEAGAATDMPITAITDDDSEMGTIPITNHDDAPHAERVADAPITDSSDEADTDVDTDMSRASQTINTDPALDNSALDVSDESIQESLMRLAEFYELKPDTKPTDNPNPNANLNKSEISSTPVDVPPDHSATVDQTASQWTGGAVSENQKTMPKLGSDLNLLPKLSDSSARCEGVWVYPTPNPNYQRAVNEASAASNQQPTDVDGTPNNQAPLFAESDYGYYDNVNYAELAGNVVLAQGTQQIEADKIVLDLTRGVAGAQGKVMFTDQAIGNVKNTQTQNKTGSAKEALDGGLIGVADSLAYSTETGQTTAYNVAFASVPLQAHGAAKRLNRPNASQYELDEVMFSTCPPTDRKWQLEAKTMDLNTDTGRGEARNTTLKIADIPVLYLPYFNFPIDSRRSSGFLLPSASVGSESGLELDVPYYFNIAPNYDATLNTHIYTNRNPMLSGEFRYLTENYGEGIVNGSYLPNDREYDGEDRSSFFYDHYWSSSSIPRLSGDAKYSYVSDADYLNDFDTLGLSDNTLNLPRRARLNYYNDLVTGELKVETFQTLDAITNSGEALEDKDKPYSRLPQLTLDYRLPWATDFDITGTSDTAYFKKSIDDGSEAEKSGVRAYNKLSAAYPIERSWGYIKPKLSLQHLYTSYDEDSLADNNLNQQDGSQSVFVPQASIDAGLHLYRSGSPFGAFDDTMGGYQLLSPRLKYTYSPFKDQNDIPNFNTRIASINYEQLFSDSWFLGHDRLQDLHAITPGINYRYIDATGVTRFDGSIAEQFYYGEGRVTLEDQTPVFSDSSSGMVWDASAQPYNNVWVDVSGALTKSYDLNYITTELRYQPTDNSLFNVGFVKRQRDDNTDQLPLSAITASAVFPVSNNWRILAQGQYDHRQDKMLDALVGVDYEDCCFGFAVYGRRYYNDLNVKDKPTQAVMAEIRLNGLGSGSGRLTRLLSEKVLGFEPVQSAWKD